jgi:hypothetical protein
MEQRYDVCYHGDRVTIEPHFCREWDEDGGCYGTNPDHGYSWEEAREQIANWYESQARIWREKEEHE